MSTIPSISSVASCLPDIHRALPQSEDAEKGVLSSFVLSPAEVGAMCRQRGVGVGHFHAPRHGEIFALLMGRWQNSEPMDFNLVAQDLRDRNRMDAIGGAAFLSSLFTYLPTAANVGYYIDILCRKAKARGLIELGTRYAAQSYDETEEVDALIAEMHREITALASDRQTRYRPMKDIVREILAEIASGNDDETWLPTGIPPLDAVLKLYRSDFLVIKGPRSSGKSALGSQIAVNMAIAGKNVMFFPLEMSARQCVKRIIAGLSGRNIEQARFAMKHALRYGTTAHTQQLQADIVNACQAVIDMSLKMPENCYNIAAIVAECRAAHATRPVDVVFVDYLQLIRAEGRFGSRQLEIGFISQSLKRLATELDCLVISPAQVNKDGDAREAMDIEQDANSIIQILFDKEANEREVKIDKQREGPIGPVPLAWNGTLTRFEQIEEGAD
mgnify:CR=1 FL=1